MTKRRFLMLSSCALSLALVGACRLRDGRVRRSARAYAAYGSGILEAVGGLFGTE